MHYARLERVLSQWQMYTSSMHLVSKHFPEYKTHTNNVSSCDGWKELSTIEASRQWASLDDIFSFSLAPHYSYSHCVHILTLHHSSLFFPFIMCGMGHLTYHCVICKFDQHTLYISLAVPRPSTRGKHHLCFFTSLLRVSLEPPKVTTASSIFVSYMEQQEGKLVVGFDES